MIESVLGTELTPEAVPAIVEPTLVERIHGAVLSWQGIFELAPLPADHLRPYVSPLYFNPPTYTAPQDPSYFKSLLLYCHEVARGDPVPQLFLVTNPRSPDIGQRLAAALADLAQLAPLVRADVLHLVPDTIAPPPVFPIANVDEIELAIESDFSDVRFLNLDDDPLPVLARTADWGVRAVGHGLLVNARIPGLQLYLPFRHWHQALTAIINSSSDNDLQRELRFAAHIVRLPLPRLGDLTPADLAVARRDDESFERFRAGIARGLRDVDRVGLDDAETLAALRAELTELKRELERAIRASTVLHNSQVGIVDFGLGAVAAGSVAAFAGLASLGAAVAGAGTAAAAGLLRRYVTARRSSAEHDALLNHVIQFWPRQPGSSG